MKQQLSEINQQIEIIDCLDPAFASYGNVRSGFAWQPLATFVSSHPLPKAGTDYVRTFEPLEALPVTQALSQACFSGRALQVGLCLGHNDRLNAMEWHADSEVICAVTDLLLLLGQLSDVVDGCYRADKAIAVTIKAGTLLELYATTLHFAPIQVHPDGFRAVIILPSMTNAPLTDAPQQAGRDPLLFAENKWMIAHSDSPQAGRGAHVGIVGDNIRIRLP